MKIETAVTYLNGLLGSGYPKQDKAVQMAIKALEEKAYREEGKIILSKADKERILEAVNCVK